MRLVPRAAILGAAWLAAGSVLAADAPAETLSADTLLAATRVLVLGDSVTHDGRWLAHVVAWMEDRGTAAEVIDCGLPAETVSSLAAEGHADGGAPRPDLAERLGRVLRLVRPDVVLACSGMECGMFQPLDERRFAAFRDGSERLHAAVERTGARIVHLTPPVYGGPPGMTSPAGAVDDDAVRAEYARWLLGKRSAGWLVINVHGPMREALAERRRTDPAFTFAADAVHPSDEGHLAIARAVLAGLGDERAAVAADLPVRLAPFMPEVTARLRVLRDAYLTAAGHPGTEPPPGPAVADAEAEARALTASLRGRRLQLRGRALPSGEWRMAIEWPRPPVVDPGPEPAGPAAVPADAVVLFDGTSLDAWRNGDAWTVADGVATVGRGNIETREEFGDCHLHVEFRTAAPARGKGQGRSNSGVFLMGRYEIQVLDSFADGSEGSLTYPDGQCGALYKQRPPAVNACRPPGAWQTYDILFTRPRFRADGTLEKPGRVSVLHNGVAIHSDTVILGSTFWHRPPAYEAHADALPIMLQDHRNPVQFRSIWVRRFEPPVPRATAND